MRAVVVGAVGSSEVAVEAFADSGWELPLVVTLPPELSGRHSDFVSLDDAARKAGADIHHTRQVNDAATISAIRECEADFLFVVGWSQICGPDFMAIAPDRVIGYHPAPIPRMRGRAAIPWTILLAEPISAGTLFWIDDGVDSGPVLEQQFFHVAPDETAASLYAKHLEALRQIMRRALVALESGSPPRIEQDENCATFASRRRPEDGLIDWQLGAVEIDRLVRAVGRPYPGAFTIAGSRRMTIWGSTPLYQPSPHHALPGQIVSREDDKLIVQTGNGLICIDEWEWDGKRPPATNLVLGRGNG